MDEYQRGVRDALLCVPSLINDSGDLRFVSRIVDSTLKTIKKGGTLDFRERLDVLLRSKP